jgi:hypothetical protein
MSTTGVKPAKRSRWLDWQPKTRIIADRESMEPTKPSKPGFVGFVGATAGEIPIIHGSSPEVSSLPAASLDFGQRFGKPHAKLFPFLGRKVRTPGGPGTLLQVFADRVTVVLDSELSECTFYSPGEIEPVSWELSR